MMKTIDWLTQPKNLWKLFGAGVFSIILFFTLVRVGVFGSLPSFEELENPNSNLASEIYSADSIMIGKYYVDNRNNVSYDELSPYLVKALIANEDKRFYDHSGIDILRTLKAIVTLGKDGGGSTVTQQLSKNMFHKKPSNIVGRVIQKAKEYVISVMLERRYTKEEIIAMYFNTFDYLYNAVGIESASRIYFNKKPKDLTINEAATFVGMLQNPIKYNPKRNPNTSFDRKATVLAQLLKSNDITATEFETLKTEHIKLNYHSESANDGLAPYFRMIVAEYLKTWAKENKKADGTNYNIYTDGLKIYTTIDTRMQRHAEQAAVQHLSSHQKILDAQFRSGWNPWKTEKGIRILKTACKYTDRWQALKDQGLNESEILNNFQTDKHKMKVFTYKGLKDTTLSPWDSVKYYKSFLQVGFMAMEPYTGYVRAWVGGPNFEFFKVDHCNYNTKRQVGSTFKPIMYALAVDNGWSTCDVFTPGMVTIGGWHPKGGGGGPQTLKYALTKSNNQMAAYIIKNFGVPATIDLSRKMGIVSDLPPYATLCLGAADISLQEMMGVYSTFPSAGICTKPQYLLRIEDKDGNVIQNFTTEMKEIFSDNTAYKVVDIMKGPVGPGGTGASLKGKFGLSGINICGKTGTTNKNTDAWFIGYTPQLVAGVWVGCDDPIIHLLYTGNGQGAAAAMPVFGLFMNKVYNDPKLALKKDMKFFTPSDSSLVKKPCGGTDDYILQDGSVGNATEVSEDNSDSEYKP